MRSRSNKFMQLGAALALISLGSAANLAVAGDNTWTNGGADFNWNTSSVNWTGPGSVWNNAAGDGAVFNSSFGGIVGPINVPGTISVNSLNFAVNGYSLNGAGSLDFVTGTSTLTTGVINVTSGTTQINVPLTSTQTAIQKIGGGVLELSAPVNVTASIPMTANGLLSANIIVGTTAYNPGVSAGTIRLLNASVLPVTARVGIGSSGVLGSSAPYLDIGSNNITIAALNFNNQNTSGPWNSLLNANNGIIGTGTLRVTGEINVIGVGGFNPGNTIAANFDLGGGAQIIRTGVTSSFGLNQALMFTGTVSNGSITKTIGFTTAGVFGSIDGMSLFGNNSYTGATVLNSGTSVATGTNASTSIKITGLAGPGGSAFSLQGANGSFLSANTIQATSGGTFILDNNAAIGASGNNVPNIPAAQNNNRISDSANIELRDGNFTYRGLAATAASETYGSLTVSGGHAVFNITPNNVGTATVTAVGNLSMNPRTTLQVTTTTTGTGNASNLLGGNARAIFNGTVPAAVGGIIPRIIGPSDFVTYDPTTGITPLASGAYSNTLAAGSNVNLLGNTGTAGSVTINSLKMTGSFATTINSGDTLGVTTGMMLSTGTHTINGPGTLDFGATPGVIFGSTTFAANSTVTGTQGLLHATGTLILNGNLAGLSGTISNIGASTTQLLTNTFAGPIEVRRGILDVRTSTLSGSNPILLGVSANDTDLLPSLPELNFANAGVGAVISRPIIIDNKGFDAAGVSLNRFSYVTKFTPLSNLTGSQTINSDITLNSSVNMQGGGGGGTGSTTFGGNITGPATFVFANGRASFTGSYTNAGGFIINSTGFTSIITFAGTGGSAPIIFNGGTNSNSGFAYSSQTNLGSGPITIQNASGSTAPTARVLANSSISNTINLNGDVVADVAPGVTGTWAGAITGDRALTKTNTGTLELTGVITQTGNIVVNAGTLLLNTNLPTSTNTVTVNNNGKLGGSGSITRTVIANSGGTLAPGNSPGILTIDGNLTLNAGSIFNVELNGTTIGTGYDNITVNGTSRTVTITNSVLTSTTTLSPPSPSSQMYIMILDDSTSTLVGNFAGIVQDGLVNIIGPGAELYSAQVSYTGDSVSNALTGGNDVVLYNFAAVPEPATVALISLLGVGATGGWYYRRQRLANEMEMSVRR